MASHAGEDSGTTMDVQNDASGEGNAGNLLAKSGILSSTEVGEAAMEAVPSSAAPPADQVDTVVPLQLSAAELDTMDLDDDLIPPGQVSRNDDVSMHNDNSLDDNDIVTLSPLFGGEGDSGNSQVPAGRGDAAGQPSRPSEPAANNTPSPAGSITNVDNQNPNPTARAALHPTWDDVASRMVTVTLLPAARPYNRR